MRCPACGHLEDRVIDSRAAKEGSAVRRRRECLACGQRFTTYEEIELGLLYVIKRDGRREPFDRSKLWGGRFSKPSSTASRPGCAVSAPAR
jgi:transcriptional repressor NrdR